MLFRQVVGARTRPAECAAASGGDVANDTRVGEIVSVEDEQALRRGFRDVDLEAVARRSEQFDDYQTCYEALPCSALENNRGLPAWLFGESAAACGCGVEGKVSGGALTIRGTLPDTLSECNEVLPLTGPPSPGFSCPE